MALLLPVHLGDRTAKEARVICGQPVDPPPEALRVDGSDLIHGNLGVHARTLDLEPATPAWMQGSGERADNDSAYQPVHLVAADYHDRTNLVDSLPIVGLRSAR